MKEKLLHRVFVIIAQGHFKMTLRCNICFEYRLTLNAIKLAIFFSKNPQSIKYCKTTLEDQKMKDHCTHAPSLLNIALFLFIFSLLLMNSRSQLKRQTSSYLTGVIYDLMSL